MEKLTATEKLIKMTSSTCSDTTVYSVSATVFADHRLAFMCGLIELDGKHSDYTDFKYGATIDEAINNYYDNIFVSKLTEEQDEMMNANLGEIFSFTHQTINEKMVRVIDGWLRLTGISKGTTISIDSVMDMSSELSEIMKVEI